MSISSELCMSIGTAATLILLAYAVVEKIRGGAGMRFRSIAIASAAVACLSFLFWAEPARFRLAYALAWALIWVVTFWPPSQQRIDHSIERWVALRKRLSKKHENDRQREASGRPR